MGTRLALLAVLTLALATGCSSVVGGDSCPSVELELRAPDGPAPDANDWSCTGRLADYPTCAPNPDNPNPPVARRLESDCADLAIMLDQDIASLGLGHVSIVLDFAGDGSVSGARAVFESACDGEGCELEVTDSTGGWYMPFLASPERDDAQSARFSIELPIGTIAGEYYEAENVPPMW